MSSNYLDHQKRLAKQKGKEGLPFSFLGTIHQEEKQRRGTDDQEQGAFTQKGRDKGGQENSTSVKRKRRIKETLPQESAAGRGGTTPS